MSPKYIIFYNHFHNGDIHVSREFVRTIIKAFPDAVPCYFHNNSRRLTLDLCPSSRNPEWFDKTRGFYFEKDTLYVNTWYNAASGKYYKDCNIFTLHSLFKHELRDLGVDIIGNNPLDYLPRYDWSKYKINKINEYFSKNTDPHILICNNLVWSGQANNFDMTFLIKALANTYPKYKFICTNEIYNQILPYNVIFAPSIIGFSSENLPEISYLSTHCPVIIGRGSGPYTFAFNKENILENPKKFVGICTPETYNWGLSSLLKKDIFVQLDYNERLLDNLSKLLEN